MHIVPQNKGKFTMNILFYCCKALIFTHPLVNEFLCGLIFMAHPVYAVRYLFHDFNLNFEPCATVISRKSTMSVTPAAK